MDKAKRAQTAETPKQPSLGLKLRAPYLYPDPGDSTRAAVDKHLRARTVYLRQRTIGSVSGGAHRAQRFRQTITHWHCQGNNRQ